MPPSRPPGHSPPVLFDPARLRAHRRRAATRWSEYDFLKARLSRDLIDRLDDTPRRFARALDLGCHGGTLAARLAGHGRVGEVLASDPAPEMAQLARAAAGAASLACSLEALPFAPASFDLVASTASLHWVNDLPGTLIQVREALKPDGLFLAAMFGGGTLAELRTVLSEAETELRGGVSPRISPLPALGDVAGLMQRAGFALPVVDIETVTVRYSDMFRLLADLRGMGEQAAFHGRQTAALRRDVLLAAAQAYQSRFADPDGRIRASFRVIWLSGWAPGPGQPRPLRPGSATARLAEAVGSQERSAGEKAGGGEPGDAGEAPDPSPDQAPNQAPGDGPAASQSKSGTSAGGAG